MRWRIEGEEAANWLTSHASDSALVQTFAPWLREVGRGQQTRPQAAHLAAPDPHIVAQAHQIIGLVLRTFEGPVHAVGESAGSHAMLSVLPGMPFQEKV